MQYSIGEFSRITRITVKALRLYQEKSLLRPDYIDPSSGYRYYSKNQIADARMISVLKDLGFSLSEISEILDSCDNDSDVVSFLRVQKKKIKARMDAYYTALNTIQTIIEYQNNIMKEDCNHEFDIEEKLVQDLFIAGCRMKGKYSDVGIGYKKLGRSLGRFIKGTPMTLYYDAEYRENDADFEACFPVAETAKTKDESISIRKLPGGRVLSLMHRGPYEELGRSYEILLDAIKEHKINAKTPGREIYHKGPGMIFKGNPKKYLTEIQILIEED